MYFKLTINRISIVKKVLGRAISFSRKEVFHAKKQRILSKEVKFFTQRSFSRKEAKDFSQRSKVFNTKKFFYVKKQRISQKEAKFLTQRSFFM